MPPSIISPIRPFFLLTGLTSTRSPTFQPVTPAPTSEISPAMSSPITTGSGTSPATIAGTVDLVEPTRTQARVASTTGLRGHRHRLLTCDVEREQGLGQVPAPHRVCAPGMVAVYRAELARTPDDRHDGKAA